MRARPQALSVSIPGQSEGLHSAVLTLFRKSLESEYSVRTINSSRFWFLVKSMLALLFSSLCLTVSHVDSSVKQDGKVLHRETAEPVLSGVCLCPCAEGMTSSQLFSLVSWSLQFRGSKWWRFQIMFLLQLNRKCQFDYLETLKNIWGRVLQLLVSVWECRRLPGPPGERWTVRTSWRLAAHPTSQSLMQSNL